MKDGSELALLNGAYMFNAHVPHDGKKHGNKRPQRGWLSRHGKHSIEGQPSAGRKKRIPEASSWLAKRFMTSSKASYKRNERLSHRSALQRFRYAPIGQTSRYRFGSHHQMSKSCRIAQKDKAINPAQNVKAIDTSAYCLHLEFPLR